MSKEMALIRNLIRVGDVSTVDATAGTVEVVFADRDNAVSGPLPCMSSEYNLPAVGDQVLCLFLGNGIEQGFCLGSFYSDVNPPPATNKEMYKKKIDDDVFFEVDKNTKELTIKATKVIINGELVNG